MSFIKKAKAGLYSNLLNAMHLLNYFRNSSQLGTAFDYTLVQTLKSCLRLKREVFWPELYN